MLSDHSSALSVLVVEDEPDLNVAVVAYLNLYGFSAYGVRNSNEFRVRVREHYADLIVVDLGLPDGDGLEIVKCLRASGHRGVVIMTARGLVEDRLNGYSVGADHYLVKPVDLRELTLVLRTVAERQNIGRGVWIVNRTECNLIAPCGSIVCLTKSELKVIHALAQRFGDEVSRQEVAEVLGLKYDELILPRIEIMMRRLRKKIARAVSGDGPIQTVRSVGYSFIGRVRVI